MAIISISRDSYSRGREIAEKVAERLQLETVGRDMLLQAADTFGVSQDVMYQAMHDAPSFLERLSSRKGCHVAEFKAVFYTRMAQDNVVYHGLAGHMFLADLPQVLKVRVVSDFEDRVDEEMRRENLTRKQATARLDRDDKERSRWARHLYGVDNHNPSHYDLCLNLHTMSMDEAVEAIVQAAQKSSFTITEQVKDRLARMAKAAELEVKLIKDLPVSSVKDDGARVVVQVTAPLIQESEILKRTNRIAESVNGVDPALLRVEFSPEVCWN